MLLRTVRVVTSLGILSISTGCLEYLNSPGGSPVLPIENVRVTLAAKSNGTAFAEDSQCFDLAVDVAEIVTFNALGGALVVPVEFTSRLAGLATLDAAYDTGQFTLNGLPLNSTTGTLQWSRFLGVRGLAGNRVVWTQTINTVAYSIEMTVQELADGCPP